MTMMIAVLMVVMMMTAAMMMMMMMMMMIVQLKDGTQLCARKGPYALHPVSDTFPHRCLFETVPIITTTAMMTLMIKIEPRTMSLPFPLNATVESPALR